MKLTFRLRSDWPKLAWVARCALQRGPIDVFHGPLVEIGTDWLVEGVWNGPFNEANFDDESLLFGSGIRRRGDRLIFVPSTTLVDRIWHARTDRACYVANTLAGLLAVTGITLRRDVHYRRLIVSLENPGFKDYLRTFPADPYDVNIHYFNTLCWDGNSFSEVPKPLTEHHFVDFSSYYRFLVDTTHALVANALDSARHNQVIPVTAISSGYDSVAISVLAREAGCKQAFNIADSSSLWRGSDSGARIAKRLKLDCRVYRQKGRNYPDEVSIIGAVGRFGALNLSLFDYPEPLSLLFTGSYGDKVWDRFPHDFSDPTGDSDMFMEEFRLTKGVFQTVVPWWAPNNFAQINALGALPEMAPWTLNTSYDRPVPRRIGEEAGVPREWFGQIKKNTSAERVFKWPYTSAAQTSFAAYLKRGGEQMPPKWTLPLMSRLAQLDKLISSNLLHRLMSRRWHPRRRIITWQQWSHHDQLFAWANETLSERYGASPHFCQYEQT